jgi:hypothetical protein
MVTDAVAFSGVRILAVTEFGNPPGAGEKRDHVKRGPIRESQSPSPDRADRRFLPPFGFDHTLSHFCF